MTASEWLSLLWGVKTPSAAVLRLLRYEVSKPDACHASATRNWPGPRSPSNTIPT